MPLVADLQGRRGAGADFGAYAGGCGGCVRVPC